MGEDKPWTDYDRLLELEEEHDTYRAIADELGCHSNTVRTHLKRAHEDTGHDLQDEDDDVVRGPETCVRCEENETPGGEKTANMICDECLDEVRHADQ